jgi:hypothetical protein
MATDRASFDDLLAQVQKLPLDDRLLLIKMVADTLRSQQPSRKHQPLVYGQFHGARLSEDDDFRIAEWRPSESDLNGS